MKIGKTAKRHSSQAGFTLIEVTVASMISMVGLLALAQLFTLATLHNQSSKQTTLATMVARHQIEQLLAIPLSGSSLSSQLNTGGALGSSNAVSGYSQNYYVNVTTKQFSTTPFFTGQQPGYVVTWKIEADNAAAPIVQLPRLRRLTVRAEATLAGMTGNAASGTQQVEVAEISTMRIR
jgi:Tfp pilus assembly protein PilV